MISRGRRNVKQPVSQKSGDFAGDRDKRCRRRYIRGDLGVGRPGGRGVWEIGRAGLIPGDEVQVLFGPFALDHNAGGCSG
jgi:hypothetical protein